MKRFYTKQIQDLPREQEQQNNTPIDTTPTKNNSILDKYSKSDYFTRPRGEGESGSSLFDSSGKKYSLVDVYDVNKKKVVTIDPYKNKEVKKFGGKIKSDWQIIE